MLIAIDHGNYNIKTPHHSFMAGLSEHSVRPPMADEILEYNGSFWTLSGKRLNYRRDKTKDESYFILSLFAIARELLHTGSYSAVEKVHLAVGLPPEHYASCEISSLSILSGLIPFTSSIMISRLRS